MKQPTKKVFVKVEHYGDVLAAGLGMKLVAYKEYGSYQGDYIAVLEKDETVYVFKGSYGSCSGCDWLESEMNHYAEDGKNIPEEKVREYVDSPDGKPFLTIPKKDLARIAKAKDIQAFFPANTRNDYDDWSWDDLRKLLTDAS